MYLYTSFLAASATSNDGGCPAVTDDGTTLKAVGANCTDATGTKWAGSVSFVRTTPAAQTGKYTFSDLASTSPVTCADGGTGSGTTTITGTMQITGAESNFTYAIDLRLDGTGLNAKTCANSTATSAWNYTGSVITAADGSKTWNGTGKLGSSEQGSVTATTTDEKIDSAVCATEAASGTTKVSASGNSIVYTYDGATKCDAEGTVLWSLNGAPKGELSGVNCAAAPGSAFLGAALLVLSLLLRRRS
jgi:uncharacterized protein (TIGR03382 family)